MRRKIDDILHPDGRLSKTEEHFSRRWLKISDLLDGMGAIDGLLDPELKNRLRAALDPLAKPAGDDDTRTTGQRYADALETLLCGGQQTHMNGVVNLETLPGGNQPGVLPDGSSIPAEDARRIAGSCGVGEVGGANISRIITDPASLPLDVAGKTASPPPASGRRWRSATRGCVVDGCTIPGRLVPGGPHHPVDPGRTDLANLALTCCFHNRCKARYPERVQVTHHPDGKITYRILRKNTPALRYRHRRGGQARDGPDAHAA